MQLFRLHPNPRECVKLYPDKYTYNQIRESGQIMLTALYLQGGDYSYTHETHPIIQWVAESFANWLDTYAITAASHEEWKKRYQHNHDKVHSSFKSINEAYSDAMDLLPRTGYTLQPCVFPDRYKIHLNPDSVEQVCENYRNYVIEDKTKKEWFKFERAEAPEMYAEAL